MQHLYKRAGRGAERSAWHVAEEGCEADLALIVGCPIPISTCPQIEGENASLEEAVRSLRQRLADAQQDLAKPTDLDRVRPLPLMLPIPPQCSA